MTLGRPRDRYLNRFGALVGPVFAVLFVSAISEACASSISPGASEVVSTIAAANPECGFERESRLALGGAKMWAVKKLVRLSGEADGAEVFSHMRRVDVATYRAANSSECSEDLWLEALTEETAVSGWAPMVMERDDFESSLVFTHSDSTGELDGILVVEFDGFELEVVRLDGRIDRVLAEALAEDPDAAVEFLQTSR